MSRFDSPLNDLRIASPCSANWDAMIGDDRQRFCGECRLNVYNLSGMTEDEAESLIINAEGRLCVRMYRRADGSVIMKDCPVGWARVKRRVRAVSTAIISLIAGLFSGLLFFSIFSRSAVKEQVGKLVVRPLTTPTPIPTMGAVARPPEATPTPEQSRKLKEVKAKVLEAEGN